MLPFISENLGAAADAQQKAGALCVLGAVLEGPRADHLRPLLHGLLDVLDSLLFHHSKLVSIGILYFVSCNNLQLLSYAVKKRLAIYPSLAGMSLTKLSLAGYIFIITGFRICIDFMRIRIGNQHFF